MEAGGFDESFECYYEDVDLGFRLNLAGHWTVYEPESLCRHLGAGSHGRHSWRRLKNSARNAEIVFFSCMPRSVILRQVPAHAAAITMQAALRTLRGGLLPFLAGKASFLVALPQVLKRRRRIQEAARPGGAAIPELLEADWLSIHACSVLGRSGIRSARLTGFCSRLSTAATKANA